MKWFDENLDREALEARLKELLSEHTDEGELSEIKDEYVKLLSALAEKSAENKEEAVPPQVTGSKGKTGLIVGVVAAVAVVAALVFAGMQKKQPEAAPAETAPAAMEETTAPTEATIPADGNPDDVTCKGSYTADEAAVVAARDTVVAVAGEKELTLGQLQAFYWMEVRSFLNQYSYYLNYIGLNPEQGFDTQRCSFDETRTWQQFFLESALNTWHNYAAMAQDGAAAGIPLGEEFARDLENLEENLAENAAQSGFESTEAFLKTSLGSGITLEDYRSFLSTYFSALSYYENWMDQQHPTEEELDAFFTLHEGGYSDSGITKDSVKVDVRHVLYMPEQSTDAQTGETSIPDEAWAAAEKLATDALAAWEQGEKTEESFAELARKESQDPGSAQNGGLYTGVTEGQMVMEFNDWCFDPTRQPGDYGIVKTTYGYHLMYFVSSTPVWQDYAEADYLNEKSEELFKASADAHPAQYRYSDMLLAQASLA